MNRRTTADRTARRAVPGRLLASGLLSLLLGACTLGGPYRRPAIPAPAAWRAASIKAGPAAWPATDWWQGFRSPALDHYLAEAEQHNDDLAAAVARVRQADAQVRIAGATLLPQIDGSAAVSRQRSFSVSGNGTHTLTEYTAAIGASYELDFWGRNRAQVTAAKATAAGARADRATVELTVLSGVASTYFQALASRDRLSLAESQLENARQILQGLNLQQQAGIADALDVAQQETTVATLAAAVPPLRLQTEQSVNALAVLLGRAPETLTLDDPDGLTRLAEPAVTPGLPAQLLNRRPDIASAEAALIAAHADVAAARAAMFPNIALTASGGYASSALAHLFDPASTIFSLAAALTQPIFEGGALAGQSEAAKARYQELLADYHKAVISAFADVENALVAVQQTREQEQRNRRAVAAAQHAFDLAQAQDEAGTIDILTLLNTQTALFNAQDQWAQIRLSHLQALVGLFNALGGGWQRPPEKS